jgi:hypothetical protein
MPKTWLQRIYRGSHWKGSGASLEEVAAVEHWDHIIAPQTMVRGGNLHYGSKARVLGVRSLQETSLQTGNVFIDSLAPLHRR